MSDSDGSRIAYETKFRSDVMTAEMHSPQVRRSEIVADENGARLVVGVPPFGPSSSAGAVGPTFEEQQWLDEEEAMEEARAMKAAEEEYVARCLTLHPNLEEAEARWLWQREKALREGRMDEG